MKNLIQTFLFLVLILPAVSQAEEPPEGAGPKPEGVGPKPEERRGFYEIHNSFESETLRISLDGSMNGFIEGKVCDECEVITVTITPDSKAYANGVEVPLKKAESRLGRYATVMYEIKTKKVSAIRW